MRSVKGLKAGTELPGDDVFAYEERESKSEKKRKAIALENVGAELAELPLEHSDRLPMSDELRAALREYKRLTSFGAKARHIQYLGRLMRTEEAEALLKGL